MSSMTNRGKAILLSSTFQGVNVPTQFTLHLILSDSPEPGPLTDTLSELTELSRTEYEPAVVSREEASFLLTEGDVGEASYIVLPDVSFTAGVNRIPLDEGHYIGFVVLCDQDENVLAYWSGESGYISPGRSLILQAFTITLSDYSNPGT